LFDYKKMSSKKQSAAKTTNRNNKKNVETIPEEVVVETVTTPVDVVVPDNVAIKVENTIVDSPETNVLHDNVEFYAKLNQILSIVSAMKKEFKTIEGKYARDLKVAQKAAGKKKKRQGTRTPSGFVKPTPISDELANFLGKEKGSEMARTAVTKEINNYIVLNNLKDKQNGRKIIPDEKLNSLLKIQEGEILTYFNLQRYMSPHFSKVVKPVVQTV